MKMNLQTQRDVIVSQSIYIQRQLGSQLQAQPTLRLGSSINRSFLPLFIQGNKSCKSCGGKKILTLFVEWKVSAEKSIDSEIFGEIYIQNMKKVIAGNYEKKNPALMIKSRLYKHLKNDLKSIIHYDFV